MNVPTSHKQTTLHVCHLAFYQSLRESQHRCYLAEKIKYQTGSGFSFLSKIQFKHTLGK